MKQARHLRVLYYKVDVYTVIPRYKVCEQRNTSLQSVRIKRNPHRKVCEKRKPHYRVCEYCAYPTAKCVICANRTTECVKSAIPHCKVCEQRNTPLQVDESWLHVMMRILLYRYGG